MKMEKIKQLSLYMQYCMQSASVDQTDLKKVP